MANETIPKAAASAQPTNPSFALRPAEFVPLPATVNAESLMMVPRCAYRLEKIPQGYKIFCVGEDSMACLTMQNRCTMLSGGQLAVGCLLDGVTCFYATLSIAVSSVEYFEGGLGILLSSDSPPLTSLLHLYGDTVLAALQGMQSCYILINGSPICVGSSLIATSILAAGIAQTPITTNLEPAQREVNQLRQTIAALTAERDAYHRAALKWAAKEISEERIQLYSREEPGLPLESFIDELEHPRGR